MGQVCRSQFDFLVSFCVDRSCLARQIRGPRLNFKAKPAKGRRNDILLCELLNWKGQLNQNFLNLHSSEVRERSSSYTFTHLLPLPRIYDCAQRSLASALGITAVWRGSCIAGILCRCLPSQFTYRQIAQKNLGGLITKTSHYGIIPPAFGMDCEQNVWWRPHRS